MFPQESHEVSVFILWLPDQMVSDVILTPSSPWCPRSLRTLSKPLFNIQLSV